MKSKYFRPTFLIFTLLLAISSCKDPAPAGTDVTGTWDRVSDFKGFARTGAVSFMVGDKVYVGLGFTGSDRPKDFYEFIPTQGDFGTWTEIANFPGVGRNGAVGFSAAGKGYVGTGFDGTNKLKDFWEYNPATDEWIQVADLPAEYRYGAVAVSFNDIGYVGTGLGASSEVGNDGNNLNDWWEYNPGSNSWVQRPAYPRKRSNAFAFRIGEKAYVGGGLNNGAYPTEFFEFDRASNQWFTKNPLGETNDENFDYDIQRQLAVSFVIGDRAFIGLGSSSQALSDIWEYNFAEDTWIEKTSFAGSIRQSAVGFALGGLGYVTTGGFGSSRFDDTWVFNPDAVEE